MKSLVECFFIVREDPVRADCDNTGVLVVVEQSLWLLWWDISVSLCYIFISCSDTDILVVVTLILLGCSFRGCW